MILTCRPDTLPVTLERPHGIADDTSATRGEERISAQGVARGVASKTLGKREWQPARVAARAAGKNRRNANTGIPLKEKGD